MVRLSPADGQATQVQAPVDVRLLVSVTAAEATGIDADWWFLVRFPDASFQHYDLGQAQFVDGMAPTHTGPLFDIDGYELSLHLSTGGSYRVYAGVDLTADGLVDPDGADLYYTELGLTADDSAGWWQPVPGTTWQWQLSGTVDTSFDVAMYDIDLFDVPQTTIAQLKSSGRIVICYFSAGSWENWREDADTFPAGVLGNVMDGWEDERWLDIRQIDLLEPIMARRLDLAVSKGCDGVEPDNVDGYVNDTGFALSYQDQIEFNSWLARQAHARGLSVGLKNDLDQVQDLLSMFDWALNEQCFEYDECAALLPFVQAGKAVFNVEYNLAPDDFCAQANGLDMDSLKKNLGLDAWRISCR